MMMMMDGMGPNAVNKGESQAGHQASWRQRKQFTRGFPHVTLIKSTALRSSLLEALLYTVRSAHPHHARHTHRDRHERGQDGKDHHSHDTDHDAYTETACGEANPTSR